MALSIHRVEIPFQEGEQRAVGRFQGAALSGDAVVSAIHSSTGVDVAAVYAQGEKSGPQPGATEQVLEHAELHLVIEVKLAAPARHEGTVALAVCSSAEHLEAVG